MSVVRRSLPKRAIGPVRALWHRIQRLDPRLVHRRREFYRWNSGSMRDTIVLRPGLTLRVEPSSRESFEWFCFRSLEMAEEMDAFLAARAGRERLLDVGACHGVFSMAFAAGRPGTRVIAVDPSAPAQACLRTNLVLNQMTNVEPLTIALGASVAPLRMRMDWHHLEVVSDEATALDALEVPCRTIDDLCAEHEFVPDTVKIDVEGYEHAVLCGARGILARSRPLLFLEVHPGRLAALGTSAADLLCELEAFGYAFYSHAGLALDRHHLADEDRVYRVVCRG